MTKKVEVTVVTTTSIPVYLEHAHPWNTYVVSRAHPWNTYVVSRTKQIIIWKCNMVFDYFFIYKEKQNQSKIAMCEMNILSLSQSYLNKIFWHSFSFFFLNADHNL